VLYRRLQEHAEGERTLRISPFGRANLRAALRWLELGTLLRPSYWIYVEISARQVRDPALDCRWSREEANEINLFIEGPMAMVKVHGFLEQFGESLPTAPWTSPLEEGEAEPSRRLGEHIAKTWGR
jgi:hypothetical protein